MTDYWPMIDQRQIDKKDTSGNNCDFTNANNNDEDNYTNPIRTKLINIMAIPTTKPMTKVLYSLVFSL